MSIMASFTSAISVLGFSLEMYKFGSMYLLIGVSYFITQPFAAHVYVPFFHKQKLTSAYEVEQQQQQQKRFTTCTRNLLTLHYVLTCLHKSTWRGGSITWPESALRSFSALKWYKKTENTMTTFWIFFGFQHITF